ncbi:MAG: HEAT repeat domain-containing protein [Terriglobia bacterium]|jgi:hypothetical protein
MTRSALLRALCGFLFLSSASAQQPNPPASAAAQPPNSASAAQEAQQPDNVVLPGDWAPELLDTILSSPNADARDSLLDAAFAAGPALVPQLEAALKDDRTAEFAAQSLAFIGGDKAFEILTSLMNDPRDLNLRRFFYGALGESRNAKATQVLLDVIARADAEPDRTVTEAAILALTVRSDLGLLPTLRETRKKLKDVVIRDDVDNAVEVIEARGHYLASPEGKEEGVSVERAVRTYFYPALKLTAPAPESASLAAKSPRPVKSAAAQPAPPKPDVSVEIRKVAFSPDKSRALAHVVFEDPTALANYDMVLQKQFGDWTIASVWLGVEMEKPEPATRPASAPEN